MRNRTPVTLSKEQSISSRLNGIASKMCSDYCKYREVMETEAPDCNIKALCDACPLKEL